MYCMEYQLPITKTITFEPDICVDYVDERDMVYTANNENPPVWAHSYMKACAGDSGSGQFITNGYEIKPEHFDNLRCVLTAVHTSRSSDKFQDDLGEKRSVPCGTYSYNAEESKKSGFQKKIYIESQDVSQRTTNSDTLNWIKTKANI